MSGDPMRRLVFVAFLLTSCSRAPSTNADAGQNLKRNYGAVMSDVGHRYELAGRAAAASRFELAAFEVDELRELFAGDLARADLPKEGPTTALASMADAFQKANLPELAKAAQAKDARAFAESFERASAACNGCHLTSGHAFIEVPSVPGKPVPDLDPVAP